MVSLVDKICHVERYCLEHLGDVWCVVSLVDYHQGGGSTMSKEQVAHVLTVVIPYHLVNFALHGVQFKCLKTCFRLLRTYPGAWRDNDSTHHTIPTAPTKHCANIYMYILVRNTVSSARIGLQEIGTGFHVLNCWECMDYQVKEKV